MFECDEWCDVSHIKSVFFLFFFFCCFVLFCIQRNCIQMLSNKTKKSWILVWLLISRSQIALVESRLTIFFFLLLITKPSWWSCVYFRFCLFVAFVFYRWNQCRKTGFLFSFFFSWFLLFVLLCFVFVCKMIVAQKDSTEWQIKWIQTWGRTTVYVKR